MRCSKSGSASCNGSGHSPRSPHVRTRERQLAYARFYAYLNQQVDGQILKLLDALDANGLTDDR